MLLIDKLLMKDKPDLPAQDRRLLDFLKQSQATIKINNVADYYWRYGQDIYDISTDFPNLAPPFEICWMEYRMPSIITINENTVHIPGELRGMNVGVLVQGMLIPDQIKGHDFFGGKTDCKWSLGVVVLFDIKRRDLSGGDVAIDIGVNSDGTVGRYGDKLAFRFVFNSRGMKPFEGLPPGQMQNYYATFAHPALLAISFMHCKNVELVENKFTSKHRRDKGQPTTKFYTLKIDPMKRILKTEGNRESTGLKNALHICRGHFKDYREKGLFGKYKGIYWWDSQVRGNSDSGIVDKDYEVD
jgi:hypothetical protein